MVLLWRKIRGFKMKQMLFQNRKRLHGNRELSSIGQRMGIVTHGIFISVLIKERKSNFIGCVEDAKGTLYKTQEDISKAFMDHLGNIQDTSTLTSIEDILHDFNTRIPAACQADLEKSHIVEEVKYTLLQMDPLNSHRPNVFPACFYQKYWQHIVRDQVSVAVSNLFNGQGL